MPKAKRRIMRELAIKEISAVDRPAQVGAKAVIMKRKGEPGYDPKNPDPSKRGRHPDADDLEKGAALTGEADGHTHLLILAGPPDGVEQTSGETTWQDGHQHPWIRTADGEIVIGTAHGMDGEPHTHEIAAMSKLEASDDATRGRSAAPSSADKAAKEKSMADKTSKAADDKNAAEELLEETNKRLERAEAVAELNDAEKAHFKSLDDGEKDAFLAKSADERKSVLDDIEKRKADADPVVYKADDGTEYRKSDDPRWVSLAKQADEDRKARIAAEKRAEDADLRKRAEDLPHLPGDVSARMAMLKAIDGIPDKEERERSLEALKAQDAGLAKAFQTHGINPVDKGDDGSPESTLQKKTEEFQKANPELSKAQAFTKFVETAEGRELHEQVAATRGRPN